MKMSSMRQAMVIFSRSLRSSATSAGCALSCAEYLEHRASYACRSPLLKALSISPSHAYGLPSSVFVCKSAQT